MSDQIFSLLEFPAEKAHPGGCDFCLSSERPVVTFVDEHDSYASCEPCYVAMAEAWDALTPQEQQEALNAA